MKELGCPVCQKMIRIPQDAVGKKLKCGGCASIHRVRENEDGPFLWVLEEVLPPAQAAETHSQAEEAAADEAPAGPKLKTRRDKFREQEATAGAPSGGGGGRRRTTSGRSRRRRF